MIVKPFFKYLEKNRSILFFFVPQSRLGLQNTPTAPLQKDKILPITSVLDMPLNNLIARIQ